MVSMIRQLASCELVVIEKQSRSKFLISSLASNISYVYAGLLYGHTEVLSFPLWAQASSSLHGHIIRWSSNSYWFRRQKSEDLGYGFWRLP